MQKIIGPKFFIPKSLRSQGYNYYKDINEITDVKNECVICLEKLELPSNEITIGMNENKYRENMVNKASYFKKIMNYLAHYDKQKKKEYMMTPCGHSFHTICLEKWLEIKIECPYCRNKIPPLEY